MKGNYDLQRFIDAQDRDYSSAVAELERGRKTGHWIWYIFPQINGLGVSGTSRQYAISCLQEAEAYLEHPVLGPRLRECTRLVTDIDGRTIQEFFGHPDYLKFRSCMTLFSHATQDNRDFVSAISKYFDGEFDPLTLRALA